jgi:hypothetical protein
MSLVLNGVVIESRVSDCFINATQMCEAGNKKFSHWHQLKSTALLIKTLENSLKSDAGIPASQSVMVIDIKKGNSDLFEQGTWIHPDLAIQLAQWAVPSFALKVSKWIRELVLTGSVSIDSTASNAELIALQQQVMRLEAERQEQEEKMRIATDELKSKDDELKSKDDQINRMHTSQAELLTYKQRNTRDETIYIVSSLEYARQGIFKIGRTKTSMKRRNSGHNNTRIADDKIKAIKTYEVHDATLTEKRIHTKLHGLLIEGEKEFFMCPYDLLKSAVDYMTKHDNDEDDTVSDIIERIYLLKEKAFDSADWTNGLPDDFFVDEAPIEPPVDDDDLSWLEDEVDIVERVSEEKTVVHARFDMVNATPKQKDEFIRACVVAYREHILKPQQANLVVWAVFKQHLIDALQIAKRKFKSRQWRSRCRAIIIQERLEFCISDQ